MKRLLLLFTLMLTIGVIVTKAQTCIHSVAMWDSYGDGWNGGSIDVLVNDVVVLNDTALHSGSGPVVINFEAAVGDDIDLIYTPGSWSYENEFIIYDGNDSILGQSGQGGATPSNILDMTGECPCFSPTNLNETNVTTTTAILGWTEIATATTWEYQYDVTGYTPATNGITTTTNSQYISGLYGRTTYDWYVRTNCEGGGFSPWEGPKTFSTPAAIQSFPFTEDWESGGIPDAWATYTGFGSNLIVDLVAYTGTFGLEQYGSNTAFFYTTDIEDAWEKAQVGMGVNKNHTTYNDVTIDLSGTIAPELSFYYAMGSYNAYPNSFWVVVDNGTGWTELFSTQSNGSAIDYTRVTLSLSNFIDDTLRIRFFRNGYSSSNYLWLDDIEVKEAPCSIAPTGLAETDVSLTTAILSWAEAGIATVWEYQYGLTGYTPLNTGIVSISNTQTISGLTHNTSYDWFVRSSCGDSIYSEWAGPSTFVTQFDAIEATPSVSDIQLWFADGIIHIRNPKMKQGAIVVFNLFGQKVTTFKLTGDTKQQQALNANDAIIIVQILVGSEVISKRIMLK